MTSPALQMSGITKAFAGNTVLRSVDLKAHAGEVHALLGENGAGKSTLMKILAGVIPPDEGSILIDGEAVQFLRPGDALARGIAMIYQELSLAPHMSVAENIFLGREPMRFAGIIDRRELLERCRRVLADYGFKLDPRIRVGLLGAASRQLVEITRAIVEARRVIVMDEPTSSLTNNEVAELFRLIRQLKDRGLAVIYISHRLEELEEITDRLTILRDGQVVYNGPWGELKTDAIIRHMAGRELQEIFPERNATIGDVRLRVEHLSRAGKFDDVSFHARAGEVIGIAGLAGAGRTELVEGIFGAQQPDKGEVWLDGSRYQTPQPRTSVNRGLGLLTEDRKRTGLCLNLSLATNITLANIGALLKHGRLERRRETEAATEYIERLRIKPPNPRRPVARFSGGNQQKALIARWLHAKTHIFLLDEPTRGVDVSARVEIYRTINRLAEAGGTVIMVSSDLPELLGMADRILVLRRGRLVAELAARKTTQEEVLRFAAVEDAPVLSDLTPAANHSSRSGLSPSDNA